MKIKRSRISHRPKTAILLATILILSACGGGSGDNRGTDTGTDTTAPEAVTLACEELGYPCTLAEVPDAILERSLSLAEEALDMIDGGASMADTRAWLEGEPGVVEIHSDDLAMRFRLDGGRGTWVVRPEAFGEVDDSVSASAVGPPARTTPRIVTGPDTPLKSALVLSPLYWEFEENEESRPYNNDGQQVAAILVNTRGYENGVQYLYNASPSDTAVTVQHFQGWQQYQVVHVDSHGYTLCENGTCHSAILFTTLAAVNADEATAAQKAALTNIGAEAIVAKRETFRCVYRAQRRFLSQ